MRKITLGENYTYVGPKRDTNEERPQTNQTGNATPNHTNRNKTNGNRIWTRHTTASRNAPNYKKLPNGAHSGMYQNTIFYNSTTEQRAERRILNREILNRGEQRIHNRTQEVRQEQKTTQQEQPRLARIPEIRKLYTHLKETHRAKNVCVNKMGIYGEIGPHRRKWINRKTEQQPNGLRKAAGNSDAHPLWKYRKQKEDKKTLQNIAIYKEHGTETHDATQTWTRWEEWIQQHSPKNNKSKQRHTN